jgi:hypothetical protein
MANCQTIIKELRFVFEDELTHVYIAVDAIGDCPISLQGWHYKVFPKSLSTIDILTHHVAGEYLLWPLDAPK